MVTESTSDANELADGSKEKLLSRMHKTKGARFAAHKRLSKKHYINGYTVAILSFYVICISVALLIYKSDLPNESNNFFTFMSVALSVLIIIISLLVASEKYDVKATLMHFCAREVLDLYTELKFSKDCDVTLDSFRKRYQDIINKYPDNHDEIDRITYSLEERPKNIGALFVYYAWYWGSVFGANIAYMLVPPIILLWWMTSC